MLPHTTLSAYSKPGYTDMGSLTGVSVLTASVRLKQFQNPGQIPPL